MKRKQRLTARSRLRAGIRCHNRFYNAMVQDLASAKKNGVYGARLAPLFSELVPAETLKTAMGVSLAFEVNLGQRRPDCVCTVQFGHGSDAKGVCILIELKTCRFSKNMNTASKNLQRKGGMRQLHDSCRLLAKTLPPGSGEILLAPVLVFVAQRGMRVLRVTRLSPQVVYSNAAVLSCTISRLAEYSPPISERSTRRRCVTRRTNSKAFRAKTTTGSIQPITQAKPAATAAVASLFSATAQANTTNAAVGYQPATISLANPLAWVASLFAPK
ncbi:nuclear protein UL24 [Equid alphaherpesvirus 4]|uniref:Protein UL24 homolog n=3 Tax=Equid alphaherpesvirus 4 TaxID=10331 RepID=UL24_EHV4|nr:nuclear protein UL24 [Equid alphaherpesvirus 4]P24432.1 RecName: Full=Protein UL24 homolog [Equine herpesvirus type 4 (strain 1942)]AAC59554.1 37 [Equid alphaherpesvirus 4]AMB15919.1 nuclear protein UL24 [Equid alphaherpesvirus 4]AMB15998.1 nuclear protein UL24 [Equid alphaherpesvirus 4]AMB16077.1 nuclear protein UL24 [Equid alphaherpesvirus 4]AMB16156.1 nuclear protein UL24 [Equid alphaherpesvirus 4]